MNTPSAIAALDARLNEQHESADVPQVRSFREFLENHARVKTTSGWKPFSFKGREAMVEIVERIDLVLGSHTGKPLKDAMLAVCGGAQWGKTILGLLLVVYLTGVRFQRIGYYLPDDDLVQGVVDGKFRPEIVDLLPWFARMMRLGKTVNESGKAVDRKGAFMVSDGQRTGLGMIRGMGKIPTTFSMDVALMDERDDIPPKNAKFVKGRMTSSELRFQVSIGTQRIHGAGQNAEFEQGSQEVYCLINPRTGAEVNPEEHWPQICRIALDGTPRPDDPQLSYEGDFKRGGQTVATYDPEALYYFADPADGTPLDRSVGKWVMRRPDRMQERKYSMRISQMGIGAIDLSQIVAHWRDAVADPEQMIVFCTDRLAIPRSTTQQLDPKILDRARTVENFPLSMAPEAGTVRFGGLDTGDRCWFSCREVVDSSRKRLRYAEQIAAGRVVERAVQLYRALGLSCLFIDSRPLINEARDICWAVHGLTDYKFPSVADPENAYMTFPGELVWDGPNRRWKGLRCAAVEFALGDSQGIRHKLGITQEGRFYPIVQCNRDEAIQGVVNDLLTVTEGVIELVAGAVRTQPVLLLPTNVTGAPPAVAVLDQHFLAGSKKEEGKDGRQRFLDKIENHYLLSATYARLAERIGGVAAVPATFHRVSAGDRNARSRSVLNSRRRGARHISQSVSRRPQRPLSLCSQLPAPRRPPTPRMTPGFSTISDAIKARNQALRFAAFATVTDLTPELMLQHVQGWKAGRLADLARIIDALEERDDVLATVVPKAVGDVTSRKWDIITAETTDPVQKELAKRQRDVLMRTYNDVIATEACDQDMEGGVRLLIEQMLSAQSQRYSAHHMQWRYLPPRVGEVHGSYTVRATHIPAWWTECSTGRLRFLRSAEQYDGDEMARMDWLVAVRRKPLGVAQAIAWLFKRTCLQDWFVYSSRFGLPGIEGVTDAPKDSPEYQVLEEAVDAAGSEFAWIRNSSTQLNLKSWAVQGELPHPSIVERMDRMLARLWRGADLSTMSAGSGSGEGASLQGGETAMLASDRAEWVSETLNRRLTDPVLQLVFGPNTPRLAYFQIVAPQTSKGFVDLAIDRFLLESGHPISQEQAAERYSRPLPPKDATTLQLPEPATPAINEASPAITSVPQTLVDELHRELKVPASWLAPLTGLFAELEQRAKSGISDKELLAAAERALKELPDLLGQMDVQALADVFERGMGTAALDAARTTFRKTPKEAKP